MPFDSIYMAVRCPKCGTTIRRDCQTKSMRRQFVLYQPGDQINYPHLFIDCTAYCNNSDCIEKRYLKGQLIASDYYFGVRIYLKDGVILEKYSTFALKD